MRQDDGQKACSDCLAGLQISRCKSDQPVQMKDRMGVIDTGAHKSAQGKCVMCTGNVINLIIHSSWPLRSVTLRSDPCLEPPPPVSPR